ncbi:hypothetical protein C6503_07525 [Candidatus Poribacteria bacterium]|nr:MAG: hypothetical protein C6503_07525 [Candidatus Poribacteria bacterium]
MLKTITVQSLTLLLIFGVMQANVAEARRSYPSIFQAWNGIENRPDIDERHRLAQHDLAFAHPYTLLRIAWNISEKQPYSGLATDLNPSQLNAAHQRKQELLSLNPNLLLLVEIRCRDARYMSRQNEADVENWWDVGYFPPDSSYWLKDNNGKPVVGWGEDTNGNGKIDENDKVLSYLIDFTNPEVQDLMVNQAVALDKSGLFDGIMIDWWNEDYATSSIGVDDWSATILTREAELEARLAILRKIREQVDDNFLILVNTNMRQIPKSAPYVNGIFMECYKQAHNKGYNLDQMLQMEKTLLWAEQHLRTPRINCLEGWRVVTDYMGDLNTRVTERDSPENQRWMRMITTLSLTHSDGYVLFGDDNAIPVPDHLHNWYDFWDADLGQPTQDRAVQYQDVTGLFIREFEKGWAVYNRSDAARTITFDEPVIAVSSSKRYSRHEIPDFDGEIFLKTDKD